MGVIFSVNDEACSTLMERLVCRGTTVTEGLSAAAVNSLSDRVQLQRATTAGRLRVSQEDLLTLLLIGWLFYPMQELRVGLLRGSQEENLSLWFITPVPSSPDEGRKWRTKGIFWWCRVNLSLINLQIQQSKVRTVEPI